MAKYEDRLTKAHLIVTVFHFLIAADSSKWGIKLGLKKRFSSYLKQYTGRGRKKIQAWCTNKFEDLYGYLRK